MRHPRVASRDLDREHSTTEEEWTEAETSLQYLRDWSEALMENRVRAQIAWVKTWVSAHTWTPMLGYDGVDRGGARAAPKPGWVWPSRESRKAAEYRARALGMEASHD
jgi:hypothetical protein